MAKLPLIRSIVEKMTYSLIKQSNKIGYTVGLLLIIAAAFIGGDVSASEQKELYSVMVTIAGIIFGVMGAWIALIKVEAESGIKTAKNKEESKKYKDRVSELVNPIAFSSFMILSTILFFLCYYIMKNITFFHEYKILLRTISFVFITGISYFQIFSVIRVLISGIEFSLHIDELHRKKVWNLRNQDLLPDKEKE